MISPNKNTLLTTMVFPVRKGQVVLAKRNQPFGQGLVTPYGGEILPDEDIVKAAVERLKAESQLEVGLDDLRKLGTVLFMGGRSLLNVSLIFKTVLDYKQVPASTRAMHEPAFYPTGGLPLTNMSPYDRAWVGKMIDRVCEEPVTIEVHQNRKSTGAPTKVVHHDNDNLGSEILKAMRNTESI